MINRNGTTIQWDSDNLPVCIDAGGGTCSSDSNWSSFSYAPDKHRYYQSAVVAGVTETTVYVGPYEAWTQAGVTKYRYHLMADDREVAEVDLTNNGSAVNEAISYVLTDHLGSVDVVTDQNGNIVVENGVQAAFSFGAFGDRRNPTTWMKPQSSSQVTADHQADR
jgi:hypothetical protein